MILVLVAVAVAAGGGLLGGDPAGDRAAAPGSHEARVTRVVDGDTIVLAGVGRARLIGVDTPEVFGPAAPQCFGRAASVFAKRTLTGASVRWAWGAERRDRYGRALVYAWLQDGRFFNEELLRAGMARVLTIGANDRYAARFARAQEAARERNAGMWAACGR